MSVYRASAAAAPLAEPAKAVSHKARLEASLRSMPVPGKDVSVAFEDLKRLVEWTAQKEELKDVKWNGLYLLKAVVAKIEYKFGEIGPEKVNAMIVNYMDMNDVLTVNDPAYAGDPTVDKIKAAFRAEAALQAKEREAALYLERARRQKHEDNEPVMMTCPSGGKCNLEMMTTRGVQREQGGGEKYNAMFPPNNIKAAEEVVQRGKERRAAPEGALWDEE